MLAIGISRFSGWLLMRWPIAARLSSNFVAQKIQTLYIDDIDGGEAAGTVRFGLDGVGYEIGRVPADIVAKYQAATGR